MRVLVVGGDGFVGWPVSMRLSSLGYKVTIVDNFSRRSIDMELGCQSLTPIKLMSERVKTWREVTGKSILFKRVDVARNYHGTFDVIKKIRPHVIIHLGEQRAAPYSMKSPSHKRYTVNNNIMATHNLLCAIVESRLDIHLVHIGSAGVYGYDHGSVPVPEGYFKFQVLAPDGRYEMRDLYPFRPGSIYHTTKTMDAMLFRFYASNDEVRITDLHQGVIWGVETEEMQFHDDLVGRFDYCGDYGTVLNRFIMQAAVKHPITLYGKGRQKRGFIHIENTCDCIKLAIENPPEKGEEPKIFNQITEQLRLSDLADIVSKMTGAEVNKVPNPRLENEDNELVLENSQFLSLGLDPIFVDSDKLKKIFELANKHIDRVDQKKIPCTSLWREDRCMLQNS